CGYALYRTSTRTSARKIHYYRCLGSDGWWYLNGAICSNPPIRQDLLDEVVWNEVLKLLENPRLIEEELGRRLEAARKASSTQRRQESLQRDLTRVRKSMERLMTAYQEDLGTNQWVSDAPIETIEDTHLPRGCVRTWRSMRDVHS